MAKKELKEEELEKVTGGKLFMTVDDYYNEMKYLDDQVLITRYLKDYKNIFKRNYILAIKKILEERGYTVDGDRISKNTMKPN